MRLNLRSINKIILLFFIAIFLGIATSKLWAQSSDSLINIKVLPHQFFDGLQGSQFEHHYFGGQKVNIPFIINNVADDTVELKAEITQLSFSLKAQYEGILEIVSTAENRMEQPFIKFTVINLPEVKRETAFELHYQIKQTNHDQWQEAGRIKIHVYPRDILKPLQGWSKNVQLRLKDREGVFTKILEDNKIEFTYSSAALLKAKDQRIVTMVVGDPGKNFLEKRKGHLNESIIILREELETIPKVLVQSYKTGILVDAHLKLVPRLANDPQVQKMLVEIIRSTNTLK